MVKVFSLFENQLLLFKAPQSKLLNRYFDNQLIVLYIFSSAACKAFFEKQMIDFDAV